MAPSKRGRWTYWFENGHKQAEGTYADSIKHGLWKHYYESGEMESRGWYSRGHKDGNWMFWHENGKEKSRGSYVVSTHHDYWRQFSTKDGLWIERHENGKLSASREYNNGVIEGAWAEFHPNEKMKNYGVYHNNQKEGKWEEGHQNGVKKTKGHYLNGLKVGVWKEWYENGQVHMEIEWDEEASQNIAQHCKVFTTCWYENGQMKEQGEYLYHSLERTGCVSSDNPEFGIVKKRYGKWREWSKDGSEVSEGCYASNDDRRANVIVCRDGVWVGKDKNGNKIWEVSYTNGKMHGPYIEWYRNGKKKGETPYNAGTPTGIYREWYEDGQIMTEGLAGMGAYKRWFANGQIEETHTVDDGDFHGLSQCYYPNGDLHKEVLYIRGHKHGIETIHEENRIIYVRYKRGKKKKIARYEDYENLWAGCDGRDKKEILGRGQLRNGQLHGPCQRLRDSEVVTECNYVKGVKHGEETAWYYKDTLTYHQTFKRCIHHYREGILNGDYEEFYPNGKIKTKGNYKDGKKSGLEQWWRETGDISGYNTYKNGLLDGWRREYHKHKKVKEEEFKDGILDGWCRSWYPNGNKKSEAVYKGYDMDYVDSVTSLPNGFGMGVIIGNYTTWHENGQLKSEGFGKKSGRHGLHIQRHEDGSIEMEVQYLNGRIDGIAQKWHEGGVLACEYKSEYGAEEFTEWSESGDLVRNHKGRVARDFASTKFRVCG